MSGIFKQETPDIEVEIKLDKAMRQAIAQQMRILADLLDPPKVKE